MDKKIVESGMKGCSSNRSWELVVHRTVEQVCCKMQPGPRILPERRRFGLVGYKLGDCKPELGVLVVQKVQRDQLGQVHQGIREIRAYQRGQQGRRDQLGQGRHCSQGDQVCQVVLRVRLDQ